MHVGGTTANGAPLCNRNARRDWFDEAAAAIGAPGLTAHELRHTAASLAVSAGANVKAGPAHARARFGGGHPRPLCRPVGRRSETWWRTGWTLWRAWRANFLRTVSGLTAPNVYPWATTFPRDEDRQGSARRAESVFAGSGCRGLRPGGGNGRSGNGPAIRDRPGWSCKQHPGQRGEGGKWRTRLGVHGSKTIPRGF